MQKFDLHLQFAAVLLCCITGIAQTQAQISFTDQTSLITTSANSFYPAAVVDMNKDGLDDIVILDSGSDLHIEYQQPGGAFNSSGFIMDLGSGSDWGHAIADIDGNGHRDIAAGGAYNDIKIVTADNAAGTSFTKTVITDDIFVQCANFMDLDNDGNIDFFACHDDAESLIYMGDGAGNLTLNSTILDMETVPASDNSGNYGSTWTDVDLDGDIDLYISKCRGGASSTTDPRRINQLFINDGAGGWTEQAAARGVASGEQTWASDLADFDNDGDFDLIMVNHTGNDLELYENDGNGFFTDVTSGAGLSATGFGVEVKAADFDNDGFQDILLAGVSEQVYRNNGDMTFTAASGSLPGLGTIAVGDLNNDGFPDFYCSPSGTDDKIYMNNANSNHWFKVELEGTTSNSDGIGARVEIDGSWGVQVREVRAGESYGIVNSFTMMFGIGTSTSIDEARIYWPSGAVDIISNPGIDQQIKVVEGGAITCTTVSVVGNLVANPSMTSASLSWSGLSNALGYEASGRKLGIGSFVAKRTAATSLTVGGLTSNTTYEWRVRARCMGAGIILTPYSPVETFTTLTLRESAGVSPTVITAWPLPAADQLIINLPLSDMQLAGIIRVTDMLGRTMLETQIDAGEQVHTLSLAELRAGQYIIELTRGSEKWSELIIKGANLSW